MALEMAIRLMILACARSPAARVVHLGGRHSPFLQTHLHHLVYHLLVLHDFAREIFDVYALARVLLQLELRRVKFMTLERSQSPLLRSSHLLPRLSLLAPPHQRLSPSC